MLRRQLLATGGLVLAGLASPAILRASIKIVEIGMRSDEDGAKVWFDPIGILIEPGTTIRWTIKENVHTVTAYHPDNDDHSLRIPTAAKPWDSSFLVNPGDHFEVNLSILGVYDYYCAPHEQAGMVGRIIVREPSGPGALPFDYFKVQNPDWEEVPDEAQQSFPSIEEIMRNGVVRV